MVPEREDGGPHGGRGRSVVFANCAVLVLSRVEKDVPVCRDWLELGKFFVSGRSYVRTAYATLSFKQGERSLLDLVQTPHRQGVSFIRRIWDCALPVIAIESYFQHDKFNPPAGLSPHPALTRTTRRPAHPHIRFLIHRRAHGHLPRADELSLDALEPWAGTTCVYAHQRPAARCVPLEPRVSRGGSGARRRRSGPHVERSTLGTQHENEDTDVGAVSNEINRRTSFVSGAGVFHESGGDDG
ncbi:hypothetical protein V8D89_007108 [Ganoderma adspersum]